MSGADPLTKLYHYRRISAEIVTSGQPTEEQFHAIAQQGFQVVINLGLAEADYALPDERGLVESLGMIYVPIPVQWQNPTLDDFQRFQERMRQHEGQLRLVHCAANMRVSCFVALYHAIEHQWTLEQALEDVKIIWTPNEVWQAFMETVLASQGE